MGIKALDSLRELCETPIPLVITHDSEDMVKIPEKLRYKGREETWFDFCQRLWIGCYEENGTDMIKLTIHLGFYAKKEVLQELQSKYDREMNFIINVEKGNNADKELAKDRIRNRILHRVKINFDLVEY